MPGLNDPLLINVLGHAGGALIFVIFLTLLFSGRGWSGGRGRYLSGLAAALSLIWNLGSLIVLVFPRLPEPVVQIVVAASFSVLSLLPAVLLHLWLEKGRPALVWGGYSLSALAVGMHFWEIRGHGVALHQSALLLITVGFLVLTGAAVAAPAFRSGSRHRPGGGRIAASMSLALFAMSFVHFGSGHAVQAWSSELVVHHAGIPLALLVLLQDYRFVLLDAFVRFLANALLAAVLTWVMIELLFRAALVERAAPGPLPEALLLIGVCLFLVLFAWLRERVLSWLTQVVFGRGSTSGVVARVKNPPHIAGEEAYLDWAAAALAEAVRAQSHGVIQMRSVEASENLHTPVLAHALAGLKADSTEVVVPIRLTHGDSRLILLGPRGGGQRYLRDDLDLLGTAAAEIVAHVEALRRQELARLVTQAELRALQSQINPHFLFNALNTLYGAIPRESSAARKMVLNLADIFRYFLQSDKTFVSLEEEMQIVRAYLDVEQHRLGSRLTVEIHIDAAALRLPIPVLAIQPLVENAIKHGVAQRSEPGYVRIVAECREDELRVCVENSSSRTASASEGAGVGLENVRRRLAICYGQSSKLDLCFNAESTTALLSIPLAGIGVGESR